MKALCVERLNDLYRGVLLCKSDEVSSLISPTVTIDGKELTMSDGSTCIVVDSNKTYVLYQGHWYARS